MSNCFSRKTLQRQLDTVQQSLEAETKNKNEQIRLKRKLEKEVSEIEGQLENADRVCTTVIHFIVKYLLISQLHRYNCILSCIFMERVLDTALLRI